MNLYGYVGDNPVNFIDPRGTDAAEVLQLTPQYPSPRRRLIRLIGLDMEG